MFLYVKTMMVVLLYFEEVSIDMRRCQYVLSPGAAQRITFVVVRLLLLSMLFPSAGFVCHFQLCCYVPITMLH